jgi:hypothetical protein
MDATALMLNRTRYMFVVALGLVFAVSGALSILFSGDDIYSLIVGLVLFLTGSAAIVFAERIEGNI